MARRNVRKRYIADINVVPYIDVMLVLLVIFMITAPLLKQGVEVELPKAEAEPLAAEEQRPVVLSVDYRGAYFLNLASNPEQPIDPESVLEQVAAALGRNPQLPVLVKADENVGYGVVVQAMVLLQRAGAAKVGLLTELPEEAAAVLEQPAVILEDRQLP